MEKKMFYIFLSPRHRYATYTLTRKSEIIFVKTVRTCAQLYHPVTTVFIGIHVIRLEANIGRKKKQIHVRSWSWTSSSPQSTNRVRRIIMKSCRLCNRDTFGGTSSRISHAWVLRFLNVS